MRSRAEAVKRGVNHWRGDQGSRDGGLASANCLIRKRRKQDGQRLEMLCAMLFSF